MKILKPSTLLFIAVCFFTEFSFSQTKDEVIDRFMEATKKYKNYHIVYRNDFKFQSSDDTNSTVVDGVYSTTLKFPFAAIINVKPNRGQQSLITYNAKYLARLWKDSLYYTIDTLRKNKYQFQNTKNEFQFNPLHYYKTNFKSAEFQIYDKDYFLFTFKDSSLSMNMVIVSKTLLFISRTTYLPMKQRDWSWFEGGVQYTNNDVIAIENLENSSFKKISKQTDSLIKVIKTHRSLDSISNLQRMVYKKLNIGDTLYNFMGHLHGTTDSIYFNQIKDSIVILDFSYTTCGPCSASVPHLINLNNNYKSKGVKLFAVDPYPNDWQRLDKYIAYYNINYPYLKIEHKISMDFGIQGFPTLFVLKNGIIKAIHNGYSQKMETEISKELEALLK